MIPSTVPDVPSIPDVGGGWISVAIDWFSTLSTVISNLYQHVTHHVSQFISLISEGFSFLSSAVDFIPTEFQTLALAMISVSIIYAVIRR